MILSKNEGGSSMKKSFVLLSIMILCVALLAGCCLRHEWADATCSEPQTCVKCGKTEGEPLGHIWENATCEEPETCSRCGDTKGEALGHSWTEATCEAPRTCSVCSKTEGESLGHTYGAWQLNGIDVDRTRQCETCGGTESQSFDAQTIVAEFLLNTVWTGTYAEVGGEALDVTSGYGNSIRLEFDDNFGMTDIFDSDSYSGTWECLAYDLSENGIYTFTFQAVEHETGDIIDTYVLTYIPNNGSSRLNPAIGVSLGGSDYLLYALDES